MPKKPTTLDTYSHNFYAEGAEPGLDEVTVEEILCREEIPPRPFDQIRLLYFTAGQGSISINGLTMSAKPGMLARVFPYHICSLKAQKDQPLTFYRLSFPLSSLMYLDIEKRYLNMDYTVLEGGNPVVQLSPDDQILVTAALVEMLREQQEALPFHHNLLLGGLFKILGLYERQAKLDLEREGAVSRSQAWEILQHMHMYFNHEGLDATTVSEKFEIDPARLGHLLRTLTGQGFAANLHEIRIRNACAMMPFEELSIAYIAHFVGYNSLSTFHRAFKKVKGLTPDQYRKGLISPTASPGTHRDTAWKILLFMLEQYSEDLKPADLAKQLFLGESTLADIIAKNFHTSFAQLLEQIRLSYACSLLGASELPIYDIALAVGYNSLRTFSRSFQEQLGTTPTLYRKRLLAIHNTMQ